MQENWFKSSHSLANGNCAEVRWRKAAASLGNGECAEVGAGGGRVQVRDTKDRAGPVLVFTPAQWRRFLAGQGRLAPRVHGPRAVHPAGFSGCQPLAGGVHFCPS